MNEPPASRRAGRPSVNKSNEHDAGLGSLRKASCRNYPQGIALWKAKEIQSDRARRQRVNIGLGSGNGWREGFLLQLSPG
ncbi:MAG: hypothetical protein KIS72_11800, partial [Luteimonas sp.]|nr:hypothetical protein [Luteimonas sp.]